MGNPDYKPSLMDVIIELLRSSDEPLSRTQIAKKLGRPNARLNPHDVKQLRKLIEVGRVEMIERNDGPVKTTSLYKLVK